MTKKIRVAVLYGGRSGEHEVSLQSAASVIKNLDPKRFEIIPIGIDKEGQWHLNQLSQLGLDTTNPLPVCTKDSALLPSPSHLQSDIPQKKASTTSFDVVFPVMHGTLCEDGTLQGLLELMDTAYVGAGVLGSAVGMDKDVSKRLVAAAGIKIPEFIVIKHPSWEADSAYYKKLIAKKFGFPVFVKPVNTGSSVGVHKAKDENELIAAIQDAFLYDVKITVEEALEVREIELAVLENINNDLQPLVSVPGEVEPHLEFYSYTAKYLDEKGASLFIPAKLTAEQTKQAQALAAQVFTVLNCEGMARVDLFLDKKSGEFVFNEVNTLPGFTKISMYPKLWDASGISYSDLLSRLIELALVRQERKQNLKRDWAI